MVSTVEFDALSPAARFPGGNVGDVYLLGDNRVLKILRRELAGDPAIRARFVDEVSFQRAVRSSRVPTVLEEGVRNGRPYFVMSCSPGVSLTRCLEDGFDGERTSLAQWIGEGLLEALADCHGAGVVHRDVKPDNLVVDLEGASVSLVDFGVACSADSHERTKVQLGSPSAWGPERLSGFAGANVRSDLFSAGVLLYTVIAHAHPFAFGTRAWAEQLERCEVPPIRAFAPGAAHLDRFFAKALAKSPEERFASAKAMSTGWVRACALAPSL